MKGQKFLKVASILMIIGGALSVIIGIIAVLGVGALMVLGGSSGMGLLYFSASLVVVASVIELIAGIKGIGACKGAEKAGECVKWGIIIAALGIASIIVGMIGGSEFSITSLVFNLLLPGLYVYGAIQMKNEAKPDRRN